MSENFLVLHSRLVDPPLSPLKRGTLRIFPPFIRGVRGDQAKYLILLRHPLTIEACNGFKNIIRPYSISTELQASGLTHLGLIVDADDSPKERWQSIRNACLDSIPDIPETISEQGLICPTNGKKFGVWIMPDNSMQGMLETFLAYMIPDESELLWTYAKEVVAEAKIKGASFIDARVDKAKIYTWLAWQEEPGRQLHQAIEYQIFNPQHPKAQVFVNWFKALYDL